jgi:TolA-binding protein
MKTTVLLAIFIVFTAPACVTTRAQLEEKKQQRAEQASANAEHAGPVPVVKTAYDMEDLKADLSRLLGRVDELEQQQGQARLAQGEHAKSLNALQDRVEKLERKPEPTPTPEEPKDYLAIGKEAYQAGKFADAVRAFENAQKDKQASDKQLEESKFLAGEAYFKLKNYRKAIVEYSKISDQHAKSSYHPKSLLKIAESFEALGSKEDADAFYSEVVDKFGKSAEAKAAKKRLKKK